MDADAELSVETMMWRDTFLSFLLLRITHEFASSSSFVFVVQQNTQSVFCNVAATSFSDWSETRGKCWSAVREQCCPAGGDPSLSYLPAAVASCPQTVNLCFAWLQLSRTCKISKQIVKLKYWERIFILSLSVSNHWMMKSNHSNATDLKMVTVTAYQVSWGHQTHPERVRRHYPD